MCQHSDKIKTEIHHQAFLTDENSKGCLLQTEEKLPHMEVLDVSKKQGKERVKYVGTSTNVDKILKKLWTYLVSVQDTRQNSSAKQHKHMFGEV